MKKPITVSVISELTTDQRVIRICTTLQQMGFEVDVIARELAGSLPLEDYPFSARRIKCFFKKGFLQYAEFNIKLFFRLLFARTDYLLANDLDTLVPNFVVSRLRNKRLFYDTHEYFTGVPELQNAPFKKGVWKFFESWIFPKLKIVYTVNDSIRQLYENEYGNTDIGVVRNLPAKIPFIKKSVPEKWQGKIILLMQGIGMHAGRGAIELIEMMKFLPANYYLVFIGGGLIWSELERNIIKDGLIGRVEMIPKVRPAELRDYTALAHLGFSMDKPVSINYEFSLPNKIFDYIHAGIPVAATPVVEVKKVIEQYRCGFCFKTNQPEMMAQEVEDVMNDPDKYEEFRRNTVNAASTLNWDNEQQKLIEIYRPYL